MTDGRISIAIYEDGILSSYELFNGDMPQPVEDPDFEELKAACREYIEAAIKGEYYGDQKQRVFEAAMEAVCGPDIWNKF